MKRNFLKISTVIIATLLVIIAVCACGGGNEGGGASSGTNTSSNTNASSNTDTGTNTDTSVDSDTSTSTDTDTDVAQTSYNVVFKDYDGTELSSVDVVEGGVAELPNDPTKEGATFVGWSGNYAEVKQDEEVFAVYSDSQNIFTVSSVEANVGETVKVTISLDGKVELCSFSLTLSYNKDALKLVNYTSEGSYQPMVNPEKDENGALLGEAEGEIKLAYASGTNKTSTSTIIELEFEALKAASTLVDLSVNSATKIVEVTQENANTAVVEAVVKIG